MENKTRVNETNNFLWCTVCLKDLTREEIWLSDDITRDGRLFCFDCAPDNAVRAKDIMRAKTH